MKMLICPLWMTNDQYPELTSPNGSLHLAGAFLIFVGSGRRHSIYTAQCPRRVPLAIWNGGGGYVGDKLEKGNTKWLGEMHFGDGWEGGTDGCGKSMKPASNRE
jgi:hypothetical protein